jgi:NAD(P)H-nitrite reductase large subunit
VRLQTGWGVVRIDEGIRGLLRVEITKLDPVGRRIDGSSRAIECDAVCLSDGFIPSVEMAELAGAAVAFQPLSRTWTVAADPDSGVTSAERVWAAGACTEPWSGARLSASAGAAAGAAAARSLLHGPTVPTHGKDRAARRLSRRLSVAFPTRPAWYERTGDEVIVCRCENVTAAAIREAACVSPEVNAVKRATRAGMGLCQGRTCQAAVAELTSAVSGRPLPEAGRLTARSPLRPTSLVTLADGSRPDSG